MPVKRMSWEGGSDPTDSLPRTHIYATDLDIFPRNRTQLSEFDKSGVLQHSRVRLAAAARLRVVQEDGGCRAVVHEQCSIQPGSRQTAPLVQPDPTQHLVQQLHGPHGRALLRDHAGRNESEIIVA